MIDLIDRLEKMGKRGAAPALAIAVFLLAACVALFATTFLVAGTGEGWLGLGIRGLGLAAGAGAMVFGMIGVRLATARTYPSAEETFPSLERDAFVRAVQEDERPICVCTRCRITIPAQFSTGACPRCASSVEYYEINTDEDAEMVILGLG